MPDLEIAKVLEDALKSFGPNGENWEQGGGDKLSYPGKTCMVLAVNELPIDNALVYKARGILSRITGADSLYAWNDAPGRTWLEVKDVYDKAIQLAKSEPVAN
jgi:hypothetical protein